IDRLSHLKIPKLTEGEVFQDARAFVVDDAGSPRSKAPGPPARGGTTLISHTVRERLLASTMIGGATLAALAAAPAFAADQPTQTVQEVVVTGSRIPHPGLTSVSPLTTVGSQDIKLQGVQNVEDLINSLPQAFADFGAMQSNGATGTATVNLRGLGDKR